MQAMKIISTEDLQRILNNRHNAGRKVTRLMRGILEDVAAHHATQAKA